MSNKRTGRMPKENPEKVRERSGGMCEAGCGKPASEIHHRRFLSRGGRHNLANLWALCGGDSGMVGGNHSGCHGRAHSGEALDGEAISRHDTRTEALIPVTDVNGVRWWLDDFGGKERDDGQPF